MSCLQAIQVYVFGTNRNKIIWCGNQIDLKNVFFLDHLDYKSVRVNINQFRTYNIVLLIATIDNIQT